MPTSIPKTIDSVDHNIKPTTPRGYGPTISAAKYICVMKRMGDWKRRSPFRKKTSYNAMPRKRKSLNLWRETCRCPRTRTHGNQTELIVCIWPKALEDALVREKELEAYVDKKKKKKNNKLKKLLIVIPTQPCCRGNDMITENGEETRAVDIPLWRKPTPARLPYSLRVQHGNTQAIYCVCWYKQRNPGVITIANNIFGSIRLSPMMFFAKAFGLTRMWLIIFKLNSGWTLPRTA
ncbi:hypothetical protein IFM89_006878 [Coptis chinensis]|uniref:Uncharacterized protein n=1 Tax=Coptis chinensis TaxID=261450 RepID=A0A835GV84_9MAGN|nr:hypothetical protein IFM89_006878 [Coptis chinensis]